MNEIWLPVDHRGVLALDCTAYEVRDANGLKPALYIIKDRDGSVRWGSHDQYIFDDFADLQSGILDLDRPRGHSHTHIIFGTN